MIHCLFSNLVKVDHVIEVTPGSNFTFSYDDGDMNVTFCALQPPNQEEGQKARFGHVPQYSNVKALANIYRYLHEWEVISLFFNCLKHKQFLVQIA